MYHFTIEIDAMSGNLLPFWRFRSQSMKYHYLDDSFWIYGLPTHELLDEVEWNSLFFHWVHTVQNIYMSQTKMSLQYIIRQAQTEPENTTVRATS